MEGFRPIVKPLNKFIKYENFKRYLRYLVINENWFVKLDLKDAFLPCLFMQPNRNSCVLDEIFQFQCMAFGLAQPPESLPNF